MSKKVLIIGLDGGCWKVFDDLIERGLMPNLKILKETGAGGILKSTIPPITPAAWTSFQTGTTPGKHNIFDFVQFNKEKKDFSLVNSDCIRIETFFEYLSKNNLKVISINLPLTYPPKPINGVMIGCFLTPNIKSDFIYPPHLKNEILSKFPNYTISPEGIFYKYNPFKRGFRKFLDGMVKQVSEKKDIALYLISNKPWDIFFIQFQSLDSLQHALWPYIDSEHPFFNETKFNLIANTYFAKLDTAIGEIVERAKSVQSKSDVLTIVLSDHGFRGVKKIFNLQGWLIKNRYLFNNDKTKKIKECFIAFAIKLDKYNLRRRLPFLRAFREKHQTLFSSHIKGKIDFQESKAIYVPILGWGNLFLSNENDNFKEEIVDSLKKIVDNEGNSVVKKVYLKDEIYNTNINDFLPDLILEPTDGYLFEAGVSTKKIKNLFRNIDLKHDKFKGMHDIEGMFIFNSEKILNDKERRVLNIWDIVPTIIYFLGLPIPSHMDGMVCKELFNAEAIKNLRVNYINTASSTPEVSYLNKNKKEEEKEIEKRLKALGYM